MDNKEAALELYLKDWSQARIAQALGVTEKTIERWKKKDHWDKTKLQQAVLMKDSTNSVWKLINYQNKALSALIDEHEKTVEQGGSYKPLDKGDLDALQKLYSIVKKKDTDLLTIIEITTELLEFIQSHDFKLAQKLSMYMTEFINQKREA